MLRHKKATSVTSNVYLLQITVFRVLHSRANRVLPQNMYAYIQGCNGDRSDHQVFIYEGRHPQTDQPTNQELAVPCHQ